MAPAYISNIEQQKSNPSAMFIKLFCYEFGLNRKWIETGRGEIYTSKKLNHMLKVERRKPTTRNTLLVTATLIAPVLPAVAAGLSLGVGVSEIIDRMKKVYGAKTATELAKVHLNVDRTAISHWIKDGRIPSKYIEIAAAKAKKDVGYFLVNEEVVEDAINVIADYIKKQINRDRKSRVNIENIKDEFRKEFSIA